MKKFLSALLCAALLLSTAACTHAPAEPSATDIYTSACNQLDGLSDITLALEIDTLISVADDELSENSEQLLTYQAKGTEDAIIAMEEKIRFGQHLSEESGVTSRATPVDYSEIWYHDTVYATQSEEYRFCGTVDADAAGERYTPVVLLDAALYGSITAEKSEVGTRIHFQQPTAPERWAIPQDAQLTEASGSAFVDTEGTLTKMHYEITYTYGSTQVKKTVDSRPMYSAKAVTAPEETEDYIPIDHVDALRTTSAAIANLAQVDTVSVQSSDIIVSEAAGITKTQSTQATMHGRRADTMAKIGTHIYLRDYANESTQEYDLEETYQNGELTSVIDGGLPTTESNIPWELVRAYVSDTLYDGIVGAEYWEDVHITDLGSLLYLEFQLSDDFGNATQNNICSTLWDDPSLLLDLASDYKNADLNSYLSIDKYTGLPVAAGFYYQGIHTIEETDCALTMQFDNSIEAPALGAYKEITNEPPQETEPENKATPLFYRVTGQDGQQMWLFGTIHVGDERTAYLPQEIRDAFEASDALAIECDTEAFEEQLEADPALAETASAFYYYDDGQEHIKNAFGEEDYAYAVMLLKAVGGYSINMPYAKPYLWSNVIEQFYLRQGYQLHADQGVEERLMAWAKELDKEILEIESTLEQLQMLTGFSEDLQLWMLADMIVYPGQEQWEGTMELYELWCSGDEAELRDAINTQWSEEDMTEEELAKYKPLMEEYNKAVSFDRNEGMLEAAVEYLESSKVVFYAVGLAHLLDNTNGLVDALQEAGYTVEQVTFEG